MGGAAPRPSTRTMVLCKGSRTAACDELLVSAALGVQRAQQGAARALFPILSPILFPIFGKANSRDFSSQKNINNNIIGTRAFRGTLS